MLVTQRQVKLSDEIVKRIREGKEEVVIIDVECTVFDTQWLPKAEIEANELAEIDGVWVDEEMAQQHFEDDGEEGEEELKKLEYKQSLVITVS